MPETPPPTDRPIEPPWLTAMVRAEPRAPLMAPFMTYLVLMLLNDAFPTRLQPLAIALHIALAGWVVWLFRHHYPPWGKPLAGPAMLVGIAAAALWVHGQYWLDSVFVGGHSLGGTMSFGWRPPFIHLEPATLVSPREVYGDGTLFWSHVVLKICRAVTIVPIVEELFWRGFILRAFVNWDRFQHVPWGQFSWVAFLGSSLLSTVQHPANWGVSIPCWMLFNVLFYKTRSLSCLMLTHAVTNFALYLYVVRSGDWRFW